MSPLPLAYFLDTIYNLTPKNFHWNEHRLGFHLDLPGRSLLGPWDHWRYEDTHSTLHLSRFLTSAWKLVPVLQSFPLPFLAIALYPRAVTRRSICIPLPAEKLHLKGPPCFFKVSVASRLFFFWIPLLPTFCLTYV